jgi:hypothetical protein
VIILTAIFLLEISQKDCLEQARCLFHNNYGRGLL